MAAAELIVNLLGIYTAIGVAFGVAFVAAGIGRVDPVAKGSTVGFKFIVLPGVALLWPLLLKRWLGARHP